MEMTTLDGDDARGADLTACDSAVSALGPGELISHGPVRTIAALRHNPRWPAGPALWTTGAVSYPGEVCDALFGGAPSSTRPTSALRAYVDDPGPRGPVEG